MDNKIKTAIGKVPLAILPLRALQGLARVFEYGSRKYGHGNFIKATMQDGAVDRYISAALRHLSAMQNDGGTVAAESALALDSESGLPHIDHAIASLVMLRAIVGRDTGCLDPGIGKDV